MGMTSHKNHKVNDNASKVVTVIDSTATSSSQTAANVLEVTSSVISHTIAHHPISTPEKEVLLIGEVPLQAPGVSLLQNMPQPDSYAKILRILLIHLDNN